MMGEKPQGDSRTGHLLRLGLTEYQEAVEIQSTLHQARVAETIGDTLILTEHVRVYTLGRTARAEHVGDGWERKMVNAIPVRVSDRGGSVTYHGPGQLVGYPILRLKRYCPGPKIYVGRLEEVLIKALGLLGLDGCRRAGLPGVWVEDRKIAALGVHIARGVTRHGFALNVMNELEPFSAIAPCGLAGLRVTSVAVETGAAATIESAERAIIQVFQEVFGLVLCEEPPAQFFSHLNLSDLSGPSPLPNTEASNGFARYDSLPSAELSH